MSANRKFSISFRLSLFYSSPHWRCHGCDGSASVVEMSPQAALSSPCFGPAGFPWPWPGFPNPRVFSMLVSVFYLVLIVCLLAIFLKIVLPLRSLLSRERRCPRCGFIDSLTRTPRRRIDRLLARVIDCRRYKCHACRWKGLLRDTSGVTATPSDAEVPVLPELQESGKRQV